MLSAGASWMPLLGATRAFSYYRNKVTPHQAPPMSIYSLPNLSLRENMKSFVVVVYLFAFTFVFLDGP